MKKNMYNFSFLVLLILTTVDFTYCQTEESINDEIKNLVFQSVLNDGWVFPDSRAGLNQVKHQIEDLFNHIKILASKQVDLKIPASTKENRPISIDLAIKFYKIELFHDSLILPLFLSSVNYEGRLSWYRIMGFRETDFHHFYERVILLAIPEEKDAYDQIKEWKINDGIINEINFKCLIDGVERASTRDRGCYVSSLLEFKKSFFIVMAPDAIANYEEAAQLY
jgi:hypothetical protein